MICHHQGRDQDDCHAHIWLKGFLILHLRNWKTLVCSIGDSGATRFVKMITLGWPWPVLLHQRSMVDFKIIWQQWLWDGPVLSHYGLFILWWAKWPMGPLVFVFFKSPHWGDSHKHSQHTFLSAIKKKKSPIFPVRLPHVGILYGSKFSLMAKVLGNKYCR